MRYPERYRKGESRPTTAAPEEATLTEAQRSSTAHSQSEAPAQPRGRFSRFSFRTFDSLRQRDFAWFFVAMLGQQSAMNMQLLVRGYLVYELTGSYARLGVIGLASAAPMLVLSPAGGVIADRFPKKAVLQAGQATSLAIAVIVGLLILTGVLNFWHLFATSVAQGTVMALMMPSRQALIPDVVGMERLMNAVSLNAAGMNLMRLGAPGLGGFLIEWIGPEWVYFLMAGLYGSAVLTLFNVQARHADEEMAQRRAANRASGIGDLVEGAKYIAGNRLMRSLLLLSFSTSVLAMPYIFLLPGYVADVFDGTAGMLGILISVSGGGALVGALFIASLPQRHRGLLFLGSAAIVGVGLLGFALAPAYAAGLAFMVVVGLGSAGRQALGNTLVQSYAEDEYRGRVMAIYMMQFSAMQFGTFLIGSIAGLIGPRVTFGGLGVGLLLLALGTAALVPRLRRLA